MKESLQYVLQNYADAEADITELAEILQQDELPEWLVSFHDELAEGIRAGLLTLGIVYSVMTREFDDQPEFGQLAAPRLAHLVPGGAIPK